MADSSVCPGCGAMLPLPDLSGLSTCPSCGRITRMAPTDVSGEGGHGAQPPRPADPAGSTWTPPPTAQPAPSTWVPGPGTQFAGSAPGQVRFSTGTDQVVGTVVRRTAWGCGTSVLISLFVLGAVLFGIFRAVGDVSSPFTSPSEQSKLYPSSGSAFVLPVTPEGGGTDLLAMVSDNSASGDSRRVLVRVSFGPDGAELVWKSAPFPADAYTLVEAVSGDTLYVGANDQVWNLSLATGAETWHATVTDKITTGCDDCFSVVGGSLVVRSDDGYVTAFRPDSNEARWTRRLVSPSGSVSVVGDRLMVVDDSATAGKPTEVLTLDPATGKVGLTVSPTCAPSEALPYAVDLDPGDPVHAIPGTGDVVAAFGFGFGCIARWDAHSGAVKWAVGNREGNYDDDREPVLTTTDLVVSQSSAGDSRIDLATGKATPLEPLADEDAVPRAIVGRTLLADTTTTRGSARGGLGAWDLDTGKRLWSKRLPGGSQPVSQDRYRSSDALFDGQDRTLLVTSGATARLFTFTGKTRSMSAQDLDIATGDLSPGTTRTFATRYESSGTVSLAVESVGRDRLVLGVDSLIEVVPLSGTGELVSWPPKD